MNNCLNPISIFEYSKQDIDNAVKKGRLFSIEIEFSLRCNFDCLYCYGPKNADFQNELSPGEIRNVILQAKDMGAKKIIILGGEPTLYPHILDMIDFIGRQDLKVEMFTNGTGITLEFAQHLFQANVLVVLKTDTFNEKLQDRLANKKGAFRIIQNALTHLKQAGYPSENALLAVSTIICRWNADELPKMWQWLRDHNIIPYFEALTPQGNLRKNNDLEVSPMALHEIFSEISNIDQSQYGLEWEPQPPLVGNRCLRHQVSCLVTSTGDVMPCVGVTIPVGNIRQQPLSDIIRNSEVIRKLKDYRNTITGPCHTCERAEGCYGCRGAAYQLTGDYLASDPMCWKNFKTSTGRSRKKSSLL